LTKTQDLIDKGLWDGVVDTVGGKILANAIVQTKPMELLQFVEMQII